MVGLVRPFLGMHRRLAIDGHLFISAPNLRAEVLNRNQAIKKPGLNKGSTGITSVPGLFSELF